MPNSRSVTHVALYESSYFILFDDDYWISSDLPTRLSTKLDNLGSHVDFVSLGPNDQWFLKMQNGRVYYDIEKNLEDKLDKSSHDPRRIWFTGDDGHIVQYEDLSLSFHNISIDLHHKLNGRQKSLPEVADLAMGMNETWWVSFKDGR
ncbi:unnamed protein product, partial [Didymodactylos carnosus]